MWPKLAFIAFAAALTINPAVAQDQPEGTLIFAAASLQNALDAALAGYDGAGDPVTVSYAGSSALAKQVEEGAPADIFFSADLDWMDYLAQKQLIASEMRVTLLSNEIVLVAPAGSDVALEIAPGFPLADALAGGKLAMAATQSVPAGRYGRASLEHLGVWDDVAGQVAETENVRAALALVSRGEAALGIVYATDAKADAGVHVIGTFPADSHPPILYPVALTATADEAAEDVFTFLTSSSAKPFYEAEGFRFVAPGS